MDFGGLDAGARQAVDQVCDRFEAAWKAWRAREQPRIEDYLQGAPDAARAALLWGLLESDLELRRKLGERPEPWEYHGRFPDDGGTIEAAFEAETVAGVEILDGGDSGPPSRRFRVLRHHADGGLGVVSVAFDEELRREVALKEIRGALAHDVHSRMRFRIEGEITGNLEHPGIVPVYSMSRHGDGRPYYAMKFIRGVRLKEAVKKFHEADEPSGRDPGERGLALRELLGRFIDVCDAIDYAHSRGFLHRDIKPENIMLGDYGETLVIDWGLVKALRRPADRGRSTCSCGADVDPNTRGRCLECGRSLESPASDSLLEEAAHPSAARTAFATEAGSVMGTPAYMSPEQSAGRADLAGPAGDVYSLGATLYFLLTGRAPFRGEDGRTLKEKVQRGDFPTPRQVDQAVSPTLEAICLKAMRLRPEDRYASPGRLAEDIKHWMADEPVAAHPEPLVQRARRWARRHRTVVAAAAAAALVAIVVQAVAAGRLAQANAHLLAANGRGRERFKLALEAVGWFDQNVSRDLIIKEKSFQPLRKRLLAEATAFYRKLEDGLRDEPDRESRSDLADAYASHASLAGETDSSAEALALQRKALEIHRELASSPDAEAGSKLEVAKDLIEVGGLLQASEGPVGALASYHEAEAIAARMVKSGDASTAAADEVMARAHLGAAHAHYRFGERAEAAAECETSRRLWQALIESDPEGRACREGLAECYMLLSSCLVHDDHAPEASAALRKAAVVWMELARAHPTLDRYQEGLAACCDSLGLIHATAGRPAEAAEDYAQALALVKDWAADYPGVTWYQYSVAHYTNNMGLGLTESGRPVEGGAACQEAMAISRRLLDADPSSASAAHTLALTYAFHGEALRLGGSPHEARMSLDQGKRRMDELILERPDVDKNDWNLPWVLWRLGLTKASTGDVAGAVEDIRRAVALHDDEGPAMARSGYRDFDRGCAHAALAGLAGRAGSGASAAEGGAEALRAVALLHRAVASGYRAPTLAVEPALDLLRARPDFQILLLDLEMPDDPFAGPD